MRTRADLSTRFPSFPDQDARSCGRAPAASVLVECASRAQPSGRQRPSEPAVTFSRSTATATQRPTPPGRTSAKNRRRSRNGGEAPVTSDSENTRAGTGRHPRRHTTRAWALFVACPKCHAMKNYWCFARAGRRISCHQERHDAAIAAGAPVFEYRRAGAGDPRGHAAGARSAT